MTILSTEAKVDIIKGYTEQLTPIIELAERHGVTRQAVYKMLRLHGIDTGKRTYQVSCGACGIVIERTRSRVRKQKHHFCSRECYHAWLDAGSLGNVLSRHGQRLAREAVAEYWDLEAGQVVHHVDGNQLHNDIHNLLVFAYQGDHVRFHRGFEAAPVFDGRKVNA